MEVHTQTVSCANCGLSFTERWQKERRAIRCGREGSMRGRVTEIYPEGARSVAAERRPPAWCGGYEQKPG